MTRAATVGAVYIPEGKASNEEAVGVQGMIGDGMSTGRIWLLARLIPISQPTKASVLQALYVPTDLSRDIEEVFVAEQHLRIPTVSTDMARVISGNSVIGFNSTPTVQILLNHGAAERTGIHFLQASAC